MRALRREGRSTSGLYHSVRQARRRAPDFGKLRKALAQLDAGDMLMVTRLDRLARSTRDLLKHLGRDRRQEGRLQVSG